MDRQNELFKHGRKSRLAFPLGITMVVLAVIGLVFVAWFCVWLTNRVMDNTREKTKFEEYLLPVVMFDPVEFESPQQADPLFLLQSSLWASLLDNPDKYTYDESAMLVVPASDLDASCAKLYGSEVKLQHQTIEDYEFTYPYDEESGTYGVPVYGQTSQFKPKVTSIDKDGDLYILTVGYIPPTTLWETATGGSDYEPEPAKYMIFTLRKVKNGYNIISIQGKDSYETQQSMSESQPQESAVSSSGSATAKAFGFARG